MRKYLLTTAASAIVALGMMALPAAAGAHLQRHALPSKYAFLQHVKHVSINQLPANDRKQALAVARKVRAEGPNVGGRARGAAGAHYYAGSNYGYLDYNYFEDDVYSDGFYDYGYYYNFDNYGDLYFTYTYWIYYPQYGEIVLYQY